MPAAVSAIAATRLALGCSGSIGPDPAPDAVARALAELAPSVAGGAPAALLLAAAQPATRPAIAQRVAGLLRQRIQAGGTIMIPLKDFRKDSQGRFMLMCP
jgi:hypothetical protein